MTRDDQVLPAAPPRRVYQCARTSSAITIDGNLDKTQWQAAQWTDDFVDIEGDLKPAPSLRTRIKMLWDDECLYIAADLVEPHVWATLTERDSVIFHDNDFEVFLCPSPDGCNYYELEINALGTVWDLTLPVKYRDGGKADSDWCIEGLRTGVHVDGAINDPTRPSRGWTVEIAIPWDALGRHTTAPGPPTIGDRWLVNFSRVQWDHRVADGKYEKIPDHPEHNWVWSPMGLIDMHLPLRWGIVEFGS